MPRRSTPHSIVDYTNDSALNDSNLVDDDHYISLQLHNDVDFTDEDYDPVPTRPTRDSQLTGVHHLDILSANPFHNALTPDRRQDMADYERFDIRAPVWGPTKREAIALSASGAISIISGVLCCIIGLMDFLLESYATESSFQVESKFGMLIMVFGGLASCKAATRMRATSLACLMGFSLLGAGAGMCDAIMQCLNQYYVRDPLEKGLDVAILIFSFIGSLASIVQVGVALSITSSATERSVSSMDAYSSITMKQKQISLALGAAQAFCGMLITSLMVGMYAALDSNSAALEAKNISNVSYLIQQRKLDIKWTLSSEMTCHGFLISTAGIAVAISSFQWTRWTQLVSLSLQGIALVTAACNHVHPLANIYSSQSFSDVDAKLSIVQLFAYSLVLVLASLSFVNSIKRLSGPGPRESTNQTQLNAAIKELAEKRGWRLYRHTALIQLCIASLYFIVWVAGFGEKFLYLLDFTPLPALVVLHAVLSYNLTLNYSAMLLMLNVAWVFLCGLYSLRDLWLFDYHAASKVPQDIPWPQYQNESFKAALPVVSKLGVHLVMVAAALMETVLSGVLILMYLRTLGDTMGIVIPNKLQHKHTMRAISILGGLQLLSAALIVNFGFILFLSNLFTVEYLGDVCTFLGLLLLGTGICTFLIPRSSAVFLPLATIMNALTFIVLWQHTDGNGLLFSRIIMHYKNHAGNEQHRAYTFSAITFALSLICQVISGLSLIGLEDVLIDAKFDSSVRVEMMVQNAVAAAENIDLVQNS